MPGTVEVDRAALKSALGSFYQFVKGHPSPELKAAFQEGAHLTKVDDKTSDDKLVRIVAQHVATCGPEYERGEAQAMIQRMKTAAGVVDEVGFQDQVQEFRQINRDRLKANLNERIVLLDNAIEDMKKERKKIPPDVLKIRQDLDAELKNCDQLSDTQIKAAINDPKFENIASEWVAEILESKAGASSTPVKAESSQSNLKQTTYMLIEEKLGNDPHYSTRATLKEQFELLHQKAGKESSSFTVPKENGPLMKEKMTDLLERIKPDPQVYAAVNRIRVTYEHKAAVVGLLEKKNLEYLAHLNARGLVKFLQETQTMSPRALMTIIKLKKLDAQYNRAMDKIDKEEKSQLNDNQKNSKPKSSHDESASATDEDTQSDEFELKDNKATGLVNAAESKVISAGPSGDAAQRRLTISKIDINPNASTDRETSQAQSQESSQEHEDRESLKYL